MQSTVYYLSAVNQPEGSSGCKKGFNIQGIPKIMGIKGTVKKK